MLVATRLVEMDLPEDRVLENLNKVSTAKRQAYMVSKRVTSSIESNVASQELFDTKFGQREKINKTKAARKHSIAKS
jgi:ATP-dependent RNA helicase DDX49/DBP8